MDTFTENITIAKLSIGNLITAADHYANPLPTFAAHLMSEAERMKKRCGYKPTPKQRACSGCGSLFRPDNHHTRCVPRTKVNKKLLRLQRKKQAGKLRGRLQQTLLERFKTSTTKMVIHCDVCKKKTVLACPSKPARIDLFKSEAEAQESVKITKSMKKKLKRRKRRLELSVMSDSGLDLSVVSARGEVPTLTSTPITSMPEKMSDVCATLSTSSNHPLSSLYSSSMSLNHSYCTNSPGRGSESSNATNTSSLSSTSEGIPPAGKRNNKKARNKLKNNRLQQLLSQEKRKKEKAESSSLHSFLASL